MCAGCAVGQIVHSALGLAESMCAGWVAGQPGVSMICQSSCWFVLERVKAVCVGCRSNFDFYDPLSPCAVQMARETQAANNPAARGLFTGNFAGGSLGSVHSD